MASGESRLKIYNSDENMKLSHCNKAARFGQFRAGQAIPITAGICDQSGLQARLMNEMLPHDSVTSARESTSALPVGATLVLKKVETFCFPVASCPLMPK